MARCIFLSLCLVAACPAVSQQTVPDAAPMNARPRVGLVLSGGGARGLAHVGVLKVLEAQRIPIDAIAGTSMGAVIGGLYASGMTPAEIEKLMSSLDWNKAFSDRPPRGDLNFRRKQDDREFLVQFPIGVKGGKFLVPRGLIQGQKLSQILRRETIGVAGIDDFDALPTRFRAIATDLETGERRVLAGGDLTEAMRASMSAPGVFTPVELDGRLLVDGGLVENLPVEVARQLGVDVLIAVDVGFQPVGRKQLKSAFAVSNQMLSILILRETARQRGLLGPGDVLIEPALGTMSSLDFTVVEQTIETGRQATVAQTARLAPLAVDEAAWSAYLAGRESQLATAPDIRFVRTDRKSSRYRERIQAELAPVVGQPLDAGAMEKRLSQLYGEDIFETLDYKVVKDGELHGIEVTARRKSWGPNYLHFGLELQDDFEGSNSFNAGVRAQVTEANRYGAEWQIDLRVGESPRLFSEFYQPIGYASRWFIAPRILAERRNFDIIEDDQRLATFRVRNHEVGLDIGREFGSWGEWRLGVRRGTGDQLLLVGDPADPDLPAAGDFDRGELFSRFSIDRLDDVYFPRRGELFTLEWNGAREGLGAASDSNRVSADASIARPLGRNAFVLSAAGGASVSGPLDVVQDFYTLGGLFNLSGLPPDSLSGPHFAIARGIYYRRIGSGGEGFLNVPMYMGISLELGNVWERRRDVGVDSARFNGSAFLGFDTLLGPVYLAAGFDEGGRRSFYLLLGRIR